MDMFGDKKEDKRVVSKDVFSANTIQNGTSITGDVNSEGSIRIDGKLDGSLFTKGKLVVGSNGVISGDVVCQKANIQGRIEGKIEVKEILVLKQSAIIQGDISTRKLVVEEGAIFDGRIEMGAPKNKSIHTNKDEPSIQKRAV
tara:strand:- start:1143 stop:1571 length:429 start_codon:yes stop_codon:yes gene_type:complete